MRTRLLPLLIAVAAALALSAAPARAAETGVNETLGQTVSSAEKAPDLGADWVRMWVLWKDVEQGQGRYTEHLVADLDQRVAALKARGVKVLVVVHRAPTWASGKTSPIAPPARPATFAALHAHDGAAGPGGRRLGAVERGGRRGVLARRPGSARLRGAAQGDLPGDQVRAAARHRRDRRHRRQRHGLRRGALRERRQGLVRRRRRPHGHRLPGRRPRLQLPRRAGPRRALRVHGLPRGARRHGAPRRRRQADLDDRARLEHADERAELVPGRHVGRQEAARRHRGRAGGVPRPGVPLPRGGPDRRRRAVVRLPGHPRLGPRRRLRPLSRRRLGEAGRRGVPRARGRVPRRRRAAA